MNLAIFAFQMSEDEVYGHVVIAMLIILVLAAAIIMWGLWRGRPRRRRSHYW